MAGENGKASPEQMAEALKSIAEDLHALRKHAGVWIAANADKLERAALARKG